MKENNKNQKSVFYLSANCYFCRMIRKLFLLLVILGSSTGIGQAQPIVKSSDLFKRTDGNPHAGKVNIMEDPALDTLISRYILANINQIEKNGYAGMEGFRIQIYSSSTRNAKEESSKINQEFLSKFPESEYPNLKSYRQFAPPVYYKIRVGDFRTKTEATRLFLLISKEFPNSYLVPDIINFPDPNTN
jgi:hypothetical protein